MTPLIWVVLGVGLGTTVLVWHWMRPAARLVVSERGILDRDLQLGWIRWEEIEGAYHPTAHDRDGLRLRLHVTDRLRRKLRDRTPDSSGDETLEVRLNLSGTDSNPVELLEEIISRTGGGGLPSGAEPAELAR